jgi:hypothetical protein
MLIRLIGDDCFDPIWIAKLYEIDGAHLGMVHRDDHSAPPFYGDHLYLRVIYVSYSETRFG